MYPELRFQIRAAYLYKLRGGVQPRKSGMPAVLWICDTRIYSGLARELVVGPVQPRFQSSSRGNSDQR